jgi:hypothetical protein
MAVEREHEEVINENYTTDHGWNSLDNSTMQKEIQETLKDSAGIIVQICHLWRPCTFPIQKNQ